MTILIALGVLFAIAFVGFKVVAFVTSVVLRIVVFLILLGIAAAVIMRMI